MVQRRQSEAPTGILERLTATLALSTVFSSGFLRSLPSHIARGVLAAITERPNVIDGISDAFARGLTCSRTRIGKPELMFSAVCPLNMSPIVTGARLTPLSGEARKTQDEYKN